MYSCVATVLMAIVTSNMHIRTAIQRLGLPENVIESMTVRGIQYAKMFEDHRGRAAFFMKENELLAIEYDTLNSCFWTDCRTLFFTENNQNTCCLTKTRDIQLFYSFVLENEE